LAVVYETIRGPKPPYIDDEWFPSSEGWVDVRDPSTGNVIDKVPSAADDDVDKAVDAAKDAFDKGIWSKIASGDRANALLGIASMLEQNFGYFTKPETVDNP
jgi:acyl-CoA reductase-like NAD-dependent aldehyde dehydrogenase